MFPDLQIHGREGDLSHILIFFVIVNGFQHGEIFDNLLDFWCLIFVFGAFGAHMSGLSATEAESFLHTFLAFFGSKFSSFDDVHIHGVWVSGLGGVGERLVGLVSGSGVLLGDFVGTFPLGLEGNGFFIPAVDGGGDSVHRHNTTHEGRRDASREISNEDILVSDFCKGGVILEVGDVFDEGWGVDIVLSLVHAFGREPGNGVTGGVMVFKRCFKLGDKGREGSHGYGGAGDGVLPECGRPGESGSFGHVGESEGDHLVISIIDFVVDEKIEAYSI